MDTKLQQHLENPEMTICGLIRRQLKRKPEETAIVDGTKRISYKELIKRVDEVAGELKHRGIKKGALVGVCMERSWELVATLIGVMQAGCAYVPLDPAYPQDRIKYMLNDSRAVAVIVDNAQTAKLCNDVSELIQITTIGNYSDTVIHASATDLAYIIYTSGSTGKPKGVAVEQRNLVAMSAAVRESFNDENLNGILAAASVCFDTSVMEVMGSLSLGGKIILAKNAIEVPHIPAVDELRTCVMVPSSVQALLATQDLPKNVNCLVFGGEALKRSLVQQVYAQKSIERVLNAYGPTEDTVYATIAEVPRDVEVVTIGTSVKGSRSYILDENLKVVAIGEPGELHLAGNKLARGYLNDERKTNERFITMQPTNEIPDNRLYKTGDLCRRLENGEIEFLGRVDQQVKIRGYRIELEEIETVTESMENIDAAAAIAVEGGIGQKILKVFVVSSAETISQEKIKSYIGERLPKYMIPQVIQQVPELPLLPNDKLDRKKLIAMHESEISQAEEQRSTVILNMENSNTVQKEQLTQTILREVASILSIGNITQITADQSFESLGLDSLTTLEFSSRLSKLVHEKVSPNAVFEYPTANSLAEFIIGNGTNSSENSTKKSFNIETDSLATFQAHIQSSHPTFQAAKATAWNVNDKSTLVQEVMRMVNNNRRNPYSKVLQTGSATKGMVGDAYNDEVQQAIIWTTNLYLGLNRDAEVMKQAEIALQKFGTGMGTSAAASGMTNQHLQFEAEFADLTGKESACLFPTGYTANVGAVAGLLGKNDVVVIDQLCHASIVDGARLCGATVRTFKHNDVEDLEKVLQSETTPYNTILVVLEGVYSMGEGAAPVAKIVRMAKKYDALVLVDEAHSFGFYGENGAGICAAQGVTDEVDFIMTTLSKAMGSLGGVVSASQKHVDLLKSSSRAYIFQASVSPADMAAALTALRRLRSDAGLQERLWSTTRYMRSQFEKAGYDLGTGDGPIVTPHFDDKDKLYAIVQGMYKRGVQTSAVTYPIVEIGKGRLRFICSAAHTFEDVDKTLAALIEAEKEVDAMVKTQRKNSTEAEVSITMLNAWSESFMRIVNQSLSMTSKEVPDMDIQITTSKTEKPMVLSLSDGIITRVNELSKKLPYCTLECSTVDGISALQRFDVQALLESICNGSCELHGQTEPFIWFFAQITAQQEANQKTAASTQNNTAEVVA